ncbi:hypothetical protein HOY80DRAFT_963103 [Tuber brumale]|nr:hypothetical protein HOY80DRAFT_963103 [Tuber brumale]
MSLRLPPLKRKNTNKYTQCWVIFLAVGEKNCILLAFASRWLVLCRFSPYNTRRYKNRIPPYQSTDPWNAGSGMSVGMGITVIIGMSGMSIFHR